MPMRDQPSHAAGEDQEGRAASELEPSSSDVLAPWSRSFLRYAALWLLAAIAGGLVLAGIADSILHRLAGFLQIIVISLFLSFAIVSGTRQLISALPDLVTNLARYLRPLGIELDQVHIEDQLRKYGSQLLSGAGSLLGGVVRVATGIVGGVFQALVIALFTFYMVA